MVSSKATSVEQYLADLQEDRREIITAIREVILKNLSEGFDETMTWGMPTYEIPLSSFADTYNKKPLMYAAIAAQKNHNAIYLSAVNCDPKAEKKLRDGYEAAGMKLNMGKSCIRFKKLEQVPLDVIGQVIASYDANAFIENYRNIKKQ